MIRYLSGNMSQLCVHACMYSQLYLEVPCNGECTLLSRLTSCWYSSIVIVRNTVNMKFSWKFRRTAMGKKMKWWCKCMGGKQKICLRVIQTLSQLVMKWLRMSHIRDDRVSGTCWYMIVDVHYDLWLKN